MAGGRSNSHIFSFLRWGRANWGGYLSELTVLKQEKMHASSCSAHKVNRKQALVRLRPIWDMRTYNQFCCYSFRCEKRRSGGDLPADDSGTFRGDAGLRTNRSHTFDHCMLMHAFYSWFYRKSLNSNVHVSFPHKVGLQRGRSRGQNFYWGAWGVCRQEFFHYFLEGRGRKIREPRETYENNIFAALNLGEGMLPSPTAGP